MGSMGNFPEGDDGNMNKFPAVPLGLTPGRVSRHQLSLEAHTHASLIAKNQKLL